MIKAVLIILLIVCVPVLALQFEFSPPAPETVAAIGTGMIDNLEMNGGIELPAIFTDTGSLPQYRDKDMKGPVRGVRQYTRKGHGRPVLENAYEYDRQGRLIRQISYARGVASVKRLINFSPRGNRTEIVYGGSYYSVLGDDAKGRSISSRIYTRNGRGAWRLGTCETTRYDDHNRKVNWTEGVGKYRLRGWIRYTPTGQIDRIEKVRDSSRYIEEFKYDSKQRIIFYRQLYNYRRNMEVNWKYDDQGTLITKWHNQYDNGPLIERYRYNIAGKLLSRENSAWVYKVINGDSSVTTVIIPSEKQVGDPPIFLRTVYSYGKSGRLENANHFSADGAPAYQHYDFNPPHNCCLIPFTESMAYSRVAYTYQKDGAHWTAYDAKGKIAQRPDYSLEPRDKMQQIIKPPITKAVLINWGKPQEQRDRYGNWISMKNGSLTTTRKISYF